MHRDHDVFVKALKHNRKLRLTFSLDEHGSSSIVRICGPMYYDLRRIAGDVLERYYFWALQRDYLKNPFSLLPSQIVRMELTDEPFYLAPLVSPGEVPEKEMRPM